MSTRVTIFTVFAALALSGCGGSDGSDGAAGPAGPTGATGATGSTGASGPGITWVQVTGTSAQAVSNTGYLADNAAQVTITLPAVPALGDIVEVSGVGAGGWKVAQNAGQSIHLDLAATAWLPRGPSKSWSGLTASADGSKLAATVDSDVIYTSTDYGVTWTAQPGSGARSWKRVVSSADGTRLFAAEVVGNVFTSSDGGVTWTAQAGASTGQWTDIATSADGMKLVAVRNPGGVFTSTDAGVNWTSSLGGGWRAVTSSADGSQLVVGGASHQVALSTDSGATWSLMTVAPTLLYGISRLESSADGATLAGLSNGVPYVSHDHGATWVQNASVTDVIAMAMSADGNTITTASYLGAVSISTDGGMRWTNLSSGTQYWSSLAMSADGSRFVAGVRGGYLFNPKSLTAQGTAGYLAGSQYQAVRLQYFGNGLFSVLDSQGLLIVE